MGFIKDKKYKGFSTEDGEDTYDEIKPTIRIPFEASSFKGVSVDDAVTVTLKGKVVGIKAKKDDSWDSGLEIELEDGSVKATGNAKEQDTVEAFMEDD